MIVFVLMEQGSVPPMGVFARSSSVLEALPDDAVLRFNHGKGSYEGGELVFEWSSERMDPCVS